MTEEPKKKIEKVDIQCPFCHSLFPRSKKRQQMRPMQFCPFCSTRLELKAISTGSNPTYIHEHLPEDPTDYIAEVGRYILLKSIGKGGMGEVFLSYDTISGRKVALKKIRSDLVTSRTLRERFIREARITSQLIHPSIIPIYDIHVDNETIYYTMAYVEGETLRNILKQMALAEDSGDPLHHTIAIHTSTQALLRIFLGIAQAVAFAHSRGVLHRDLKPENVIIGRYGQVIILDWGLTKLIEEDGDSEEIIVPNIPQQKKRKNNNLTKLGKLVGTIAYLAPEKALGKPSSVQTDMYALGVILYQMLTLSLPFHRKSIKEFQTKIPQEKYTPPEIRAPHRDVPQSLSEIVKRCLMRDPIDRFRSVDELIEHVEGYLEGRSEWIESSVLNLNQKTDWSFEEHILLTEHNAISTRIEDAEWCRILISKERFIDNIQISSTVFLTDTQKGVGFLLGVPEAEIRHHILDGYCIWIASKNSHKEAPSKILRHGISILELSNLFLEPNSSYSIRIERIDRTVTVWINEERVCVKTCFLPVLGDHVGVLLKDASPPMDKLFISSGSMNILINRLAVPDSFLAVMNFDQALHEYRKIAALFPGRVEGREALFRAGICLLEKAENHTIFDEALYDLALDEFEKLKNSPGAPLEYLGKSLVYHSLQEYDEEVKCFELIFMRYPKHPLIPLISESVIEQVHEMARSDRKAAYAFISLMLRKLPKSFIQQPSTKTLLQALEGSWEIPRLFQPMPPLQMHPHSQIPRCLILAFWLQKGYLAYEIFAELIQMPILSKAHIFNSLVTLSLAAPYDYHTTLKTWKESLSDDERQEFHDLFLTFEFLSEVIRSDAANISIPSAIRTNLDPYSISYLLDRFNAYGKFQATLEMTQNDTTGRYAEYRIEAYLHLGMIYEAEKILDSIDPNIVNNINSPLFYWQGALFVAMGSMEKMKQYFEQLLETPTPRSWLIGAFVLANKLPLHSVKTGWLHRAFPYEKELLSRQLRAIQKKIEEKL